MTASTIELRFEPLERDVLRGVRAPTLERERRGVDLGVVPFFADERPLQGLAALLDWRGCGFLSRLIRGGWLSGAAREALLMPGPPGSPAARLVLFGLGPSDAFVGAEAERLVHDIVRVVARLQPHDVLFSMPAWLQEAERSRATLTALTAALQADGVHRLALPPVTPVPKSRPIMPGVASRAQQRGAVRRPTPLPMSTEPATVGGRRSAELDGEGAAPEAQVSASGPTSAADDANASDEVWNGPGREASDVESATVRWWIVAQEDHVGPLREVIVHDCGAEPAPG